MAKKNTNDIKLLANEVFNNKRLAEPLILFALSVNKQECLRRVAKDNHLTFEMQKLADTSWNNVIVLLKNNDSFLSDNFHKVYRSYLVERDKQKAINHSKSLRLKRTRELQRKKGITTYRLYTDLRLNHGNVHAYIKNGSLNKVSLNVADKILDYLELV